MTVRLAVAGQPVVSERLAGRILDGDLAEASESQQVAIAYADMVMTQPGQMSESLIADLHRCFSNAQIAELTLKILKFNMQKVTVACGHDMTITHDALTRQGWGADGSFVAAPAPVN